MEVVGEYNTIKRNHEDVLGSIPGVVENVVLLGGRSDRPKQRVLEPKEGEDEN